MSSDRGSTPCPHAACAQVGMFEARCDCTALCAPCADIGALVTALSERSAATWDSPETRSPIRVSVPRCGSGLRLAVAPGCQCPRWRRRVPVRRHGRPFTIACKHCARPWRHVPFVGGRSTRASGAWPSRRLAQSLLTTTAGTALSPPSGGVAPVTSLGTSVDWLDLYTMYVAWQHAAVPAHDPK